MAADTSAIIQKLNAIVAEAIDIRLTAKAIGSSTFPR